MPEFFPNEALKTCKYLLKILNTFKCKKETFRIHIPVETNSNVELLLNDKPIKMKKGECWYCNFHIKHEVHNRSNQQRTHLILEYGKRLARGNGFKFY